MYLSTVVFCFSIIDRIVQSDPHHDNPTTTGRKHVQAITEGLVGRLRLFITKLVLVRYDLDWDKVGLRARARRVTG